MGKKEPRTERIVARFTKDEVESIECMARAEGLNVSQFVRKTILKRWESVKIFLDIMSDKA